jgi:hypothetical protein
MLLLTGSIPKPLPVEKLVSEHAAARALHCGIITPPACLCGDADNEFHRFTVAPGTRIQGDVHVYVRVLDGAADRTPFTEAVGGEVLALVEVSERVGGENRRIQPPNNSSTLPSIKRQLQVSPAHACLLQCLGSEHALFADSFLLTLPDRSTLPRRTVYPTKQGMLASNFTWRGYALSKSGRSWVGFVLLARSRLRMRISW